MIVGMDDNVACTALSEGSSTKLCPIGQRERACSDADIAALTHGNRIQVTGVNATDNATIVQNNAIARIENYTTRIALSASGCLQYCLIESKRICGDADIAALTHTTYTNQNSNNRSVSTANGVGNDRNVSRLSAN